MPEKTEGIKKTLVLPPIQGAVLPEELSPEVAELSYLIPYDASTVVFLEKLNTLKDPALLSEESFEKILQRIKFYKKAMPSSFFNKIDGIVTKVLKYNKNAMEEYKKIKEMKEWS